MWSWQQFTNKNVDVNAITIEQNVNIIYHNFQLIYNLQLPVWNSFLKREGIGSELSSAADD